MSPSNQPDSPDLSPVKAARREKILDAGQALFTRLGMRGTTMEGLADAAGMSKVTLYGYFRDKDAVFSAVADRMAARIEARVRHALAIDGTLADRIAGALVEKHRLVHGVVRVSPFAQELFAEGERTSASTIAGLDDTIEGLLAESLIADGREEGEAWHVTRLLFGAAKGIADHIADMDETAQAIAATVRAVLRR